MNELVVGTLIYLAVKIGGYTLFAKFLNRTFAKDLNIWTVGLTRTGIGIVLGSLFHLAVGYSGIEVTSGRSPLGGDDTIIYLAALVVLRYLEWSLLIFWFYTRRVKITATTNRAALAGIGWSFLLDLPSLTGVIVVLATIC